MRLARFSPALGLAAFAWGAAEAVFFFIVADVLISWAAVNRGVRTAGTLALLCAAGAAVGGGVVHVWSEAAPASAVRVIEAVPGVRSGAVDGASAAMRREGLAVPLRGSFSGEPYKVYSAAAPGAGMSLPAWVLAAGPLRLPRFLLTALVFALVGRALRARLRARTSNILLAAGWAAFYAVFWASGPG